MRFLAITILALAPLGLAADTKPASHELSFVQLTDAHVFDEGKRDEGVEPYRKALDARAALHWAIDAVNASSTGNNRIDFVVYTGDFGLENVFFSEPACSVVPLRPFKGIPPYSADLASKELAIELNRLNVPIFLVVVGNNDLIDEKVVDGGRFGCFVQKLRDALRALGSRLDVRTLSPDRAMDFSGFRVTGFNSASFKDASRYAQDCTNSANSSLRTILEQGCPRPQFEALDHLIDSSASPLIVFTHVPDLVDAFGKEQDPSLTKSSWDLDRNGKDIRLWEKLVSKNSFLALFAGHFHLNDDRIYGTNTGTAHLYTSVTAGKKTWVAPPLAGKFQPPGNQVRGFLKVRITNGQAGATVTCEKVLYKALPGLEKEPGRKTSMSPLSFFGLQIIVILIMGLLGGFLNFLRNRTKRPTEARAIETGATSPTQLPSGGSELTANLWWGIGAAILVPLFLHVIGSDIVKNMQRDTGPDYSQVLIFGGFCLVAAISAQNFVNSISDRVLKTAEEAEEKAAQAQITVEQAKKQVMQTQTIVEHLVEPAESRSSSEAVKAPEANISDEEWKVLRALSETTKYVLRTSNGLAVETGIDKPSIDRILAQLQSKRLVATTLFTGKDGQDREYWYIAPEGRAASETKVPTPQKPL